MSTLADLCASLSLTEAKHETEFRRLVDAIAKVDPALAQSVVVQVEILVRMHSTEQLKRAGDELIKDLEVRIDDVARAKVEVHMRGLISTVSQTAKNSIGSLEAAAKSRLEDADPTVRPKARATMGIAMILMVLVGVVIGQYVRLPPEVPSFHVAVLVGTGAVLHWFLQWIGGTIGRVLAS